MSRNTLLVTLAAAAIAAVVIVVLIAAGSDGDTDAATTTTATTTATEPPATSTTLPPSSTTTPTAVELPAEIEAAVRTWDTDWTDRTIDLEELKLGIPAADPRDRIAPLDFPAYESVESADEWLVDAEIGVLFEIGDAARFHPIRILTAHEVVNDEVDGTPYALTYCPLCNTAVAFDRRVEGQTLRFGVSGLLRKSDLVMWDDATTSLWQQITGEAIVGNFAGTQLDLLPTATVTWADFKAAHPDGEVLSRDTGFGFGYGSNGYVGYTSGPGPYTRFFQDEIDPRFPALSRVVGVRVGEATKAYPFEVIGEERVVNDELAGVPITVWWAATGAADQFDSQRPGEGRTIGTGVAFLATVDEQVLTFGPADATTFTDAETGSTWTIFGEAIDGPLAGTQLETALHQNEFWFAWAAFNQDAPVHGG
jgi:hypothetical protein